MKVKNDPKVEYVNHPSHYNSHPSGVEAIAICEHMGFNLGNAFKYAFRADQKWETLEDLKKAKWYLVREAMFRKARRIRRWLSWLTWSPLPHPLKCDMRAVIHCETRFPPYMRRAVLQMFQAHRYPHDPAPLEEAAQEIQKVINTLQSTYAKNHTS